MTSQDAAPAAGGATPEEIARWMLDRLEETGRLRQRSTAREIAVRFGAGFTYRNKNKHPAIDERILKAFGVLTGDTVIWVRRGYYWRKRELGDAPGRSQARRTRQAPGSGR